ncbi:MAG: cytochrome c biogenesis protein CcsA [Desulfohalobiaceae bacterium]
MDFFSLFDLCIALLYFLGSLIYVAGILGYKPELRQASLVMTLVGFGLHTVDLVLKVSTESMFSFAQLQFYFSLLAWSFLLMYLILWWRLKLQFLALTAAPLALVLFTSSMVVQETQMPIPPRLSELWFGLHIGSLFLSIALLAMAFGAGVGYLYLHRQIKNKVRLSQMRKDFPALTSLDRVNHWAVSLGFPLFTVGMLSGFIWARFTWGEIFSWDPKEIFSLGIWLMFAYLFHQRLLLSLKGRRPAILAITIFGLSIASLLIINFYFPTHHSFKP